MGYLGGVRFDIWWYRAVSKPSSRLRVPRIGRLHSCTGDERASKGTRLGPTSQESYLWERCNLCRITWKTRGTGYSTGTRYLATGRHRLEPPSGGNIIQVEDALTINQAVDPEA